MNCTIFFADGRVKVRRIGKVSLYSPWVLSSLRHGLNPWAYLTDLGGDGPRLPATDVPCKLFWALYSLALLIFFTSTFDLIELVFQLPHIGQPAGQWRNRVPAGGDHFAKTAQLLGQLAEVIAEIGGKRLCTRREPAFDGKVEKLPDDGRAATQPRVADAARVESSFSHQGRVLARHGTARHSTVQYTACRHRSLP